jgi:hypothetical protein
MLRRALAPTTGGTMGPSASAAVAAASGGRSARHDGRQPCHRAAATHARDTTTTTTTTTSREGDVELRDHAWGVTTQNQNRAGVGVARASRDGENNNNQQTPPGQIIDSGPPTLGSVQCAQAMPMETDTVTPVLEGGGGGNGGDLTVEKRSRAAAERERAGCAAQGGGDKNLAAGGVTVAVASTAAATAAALSAPPRYHAWEGVTSAPVAHEEPTAAAGKRELLEAAALRCQWQIAWLEEEGGVRLVVDEGGGEGGGGGYASGVPNLCSRPFTEVHRAMLAVCLNACSSMTTSALARLKTKATGAGDGGGGGGGKAAATASARRLAPAGTTDTHVNDGGDDVEKAILSRTDAFLSSRPAIRKLRRRSKASAVALRRCVADAHTVSRVVGSGATRGPSPAPAPAPGGGGGGYPLTCGLLRGDGGRRRRNARALETSEASEATGGGLLGRLLKERADKVGLDSCCIQ